MTSYSAVPARPDRGTKFIAAILPKCTSPPRISTSCSARAQDATQGGILGEGWQVDVALDPKLVITWFREEQLAERKNPGQFRPSTQLSRASKSWGSMKWESPRLRFMRVSARKKEASGGSPIENVEIGRGRWYHSRNSRAKDSITER